jgi:hypothetical protein
MLGAQEATRRTCEMNLLLHFLFCLQRNEVISRMRLPSFFSYSWPRLLLMKLALCSLESILLGEVIVD